MYDSFDIPIAFVQFKVKDLPKPTKLSVSRGKRKCTIKFKKSSAATKCMIYRSTKKSGIAYSVYTAPKRSGKVK